MSRLGPVAAAISRLHPRAARWPVWLVLAITVLLISAACDHTNTYPIDFFAEMHYQRFYRFGEPTRPYSPASAVPMPSNLTPGLSYQWPGGAQTTVPDYTIEEAKTALKQPLQANNETLKAGQELYTRNCVQCHGDKGLGVDTPQGDRKPGVNQACQQANPTNCPGAGTDGNGGANAFMVNYFTDNHQIPPANLTSDQIKSLSDGELFYYLSNGIADMPPFGNLLTPEQRWAIILYIRHLQGQV